VIISDVWIKGFWGRNEVRTNIFKDVTIFIGENGTGKTTFINLITAALTVDLAQLNNLEFEEIIINLHEPNLGKRKRKIVISRFLQPDNSPLKVFEYKIGTEKFQVYLDARVRFEGNKGIRSGVSFSQEYRRQFLDLKQKISEFVEISHISVYRQSYMESFEGDARPRNTPVDERLDQLFNQFAKYELKLVNELNKRSDKFQREVISSLLYDEKLDNFNTAINNVSQINLGTQQDKLTRAFSELGINDKSELIEIHINRFKAAINDLDFSKNSRKNSSINADDVLILPLIYRTNRIIDLLTQSEKDKRSIEEPRQKLFDTLRVFMETKQFESERKAGGFSFLIDGNSTKYPWTNLSSGEKQLLIQFLEVLLQEDKSLIFIADEPELSLHLKWQEKLLKTLRSLNKNAQLIVATHSPEIVSEYDQNVVDMKEIIF
jgi:predicted ATP-dependent endonuclease of OLD family